MNEGDYVLATKWHDGDPADQWCVGFYDEEINGQHFVTDTDGEQFRDNGFRRVEKISRNRGAFILQNAKNSSRSLWWWSRVKME